MTILLNWLSRKHSAAVVLNACLFCMASPVFSQSTDQLAEVGSFESIGRPVTEEAVRELDAIKLGWGSGPLLVSYDRLAKLLFRAQESAPSEPLDGLVVEISSFAIMDDLLLAEFKNDFVGFWHVKKPFVDALLDNTLLGNLSLDTSKVTVMALLKSLSQAGSFDGPSSLVQATNELNLLRASIKPDDLSSGAGVTSSRIDPSQVQTLELRQALEDAERKYKQERQNQIQYDQARRMETIYMPLIRNAIVRMKLEKRLNPDHLRSALKLNKTDEKFARDVTSGTTVTDPDWVDWSQFKPKSEQP